MREIKFRGKDFKGQWIKFDLFSMNMMRVGRIELNTIGQYTGLKDKNGVEIYEGDIVNVTDFEYGHCIGKVSYEEKACCYRVIGSLLNYELGIYQDGIEVIGNIYDNPELLEEL